MIQEIKQKISRMRKQYNYKIHRTDTHKTSARSQDPPNIQRMVGIYEYIMWMSALLISLVTKSVSVSSQLCVIF